MKDELKLPLVGFQSNEFTIFLSGYLLNVEIQSVQYDPTVSDEVLIKCKAVKK